MIKNREQIIKSSKAYSLKGLIIYFLKLGAIGFGGPVALVGYMEQDLVEKWGWITKEEYLRGLTLAQLAPGPLAAQLAIYIGYMKGKVLGATLVGTVFVLPSFVMVVILGILYASYGGLVWMQSLFYGIGAAAIGIMVKSAFGVDDFFINGLQFLGNWFPGKFSINQFSGFICDSNI